MNLKTMSLNELLNIINTTQDLNLLADAEDEYVNRVCCNEDDYSYEFEEVD